MSNYVTKMEHLKLLRPNKTLSADRLIKSYNNCNDEEKNARDENAEALFRSHLNEDVKTIAENVRTIRSISVIYFILSVIAAIYFAVEYS